MQEKGDLKQIEKYGTQEEKKDGKKCKRKESVCFLYRKPEHGRSVVQKVCIRPGYSMTATVKKAKGRRRSVGEAV